ncbi:MAG: ribonuclease Z [Muribaculaceae bacterium]|nr:ribonuclease Z [Muribaculaceae bacterium]MDE7335210.1 ribonuclease Z [Muribaculaceae bacterium]
MKLTILGCGSASPSLRHLPSSQVIDHGGKLFMVDCGEGAQLEMMRRRIRFGKLNNIFISHIHGDHFLGLPGLLSTMALNEKGSAVTIHCVAEGADVLRHVLDVVLGQPPFEIRYNIIDPTARHQLLYEDSSLTVSSFPLYHRIDCVGFIFREKSHGRHIDGPAVQFHGVPHYFISNLRQGEDFIKPDGTVIANRLLTKDPSPTRSYAYCTDTMADRRVVASVRGVNTIFHDATYGDDGEPFATRYGHSTARQAANIARLAGADTLILGHFSRRYDSEQPLADQAAEVFPGRIILANEGLQIDL